MNWPPVFSETGRVVACRLSSLRSQKECVGIDGRRGEEFERVGPPSLSRDGKQVAYRAQEHLRSFVVVDGRRGPAFDYVTDPVISGDGTSVAYGARESGQGWVMVLGELRVSVPDQPVLFRGPDAFGYWHSEASGSGTSRVRVTVNGTTGAWFSLVGTPTIGPDGKTVAYAADDGPRRYIVIGDRKVAVEGRETDPVFSPDGRNVGYGARLGREIWWKVLDAY